MDTKSAEIKEKLKASIDNMSDEDLKLLSYRLQLLAIQKEIFAMEKQIEQYKKEDDS